MAACAHCGQPATHRCGATGALLCWGHARVAVVGGRAPRRAGEVPVTVTVAGPGHRDDLARIMLDFWGKTDNMLTFGRAWDMLAERAVVAEGS